MSQPILQKDTSQWHKILTEVDVNFCCGGIMFVGTQRVASAENRFTGIRHRADTQVRTLR